jgi:hypothetical protein
MPKRDEKTLNSQGAAQRRQLAYVGRACFKWNPNQILCAAEAIRVVRKALGNAGN